MKNRFIRFKYRKERSILSDTLPYEIPLCFSNRGIYKFILENKISFECGNITFDRVKKNKDTIKRICSMLFGDGNEVVYDRWTEPFAYKISHKENEPRILSIPHPGSQINVADFYNKYKESIIYYCNKSSFSIRHPKKIARYIVHKDTTNKLKKTSEDSVVEQYDKEYDNLKSFFSVKDYSNIHKFYESYKYQKSEKKYGNMLKLDISQCFDSIYTHSISWAVWGKELAKNNTKKNNNMPYDFDNLMKSMNLGETNGILIGSEFSRIFSEIILQSVDKNVEIRLKEEGINFKVDYEIFRYVDDYFIFYKDEKNKLKIIEILQDELRIFKMKINIAKSEEYKRPIITDLTIFKDKIAKVLTNKINREKIEDESETDNKNYFKYKVKIIEIKKEFKALVKKGNVNYKDVLNYSLAVVKNKTENILEEYLKNTREDKKIETGIIKFLYNILDFSFFVYVSEPRVNSTIKLSHIILMILKFVDVAEFDEIDKDLLFKKIHQEIKLVLKQNKIEKHRELETLYLLVVLRELNDNYQLTENDLFEYLNIDKEKSNINYFLFIVSIFYIQGNKSYNQLKPIIVEKVWKKLKDVKVFKKSELTMMLFDFISCPYIEKKYKLDILNFHNVSNNEQEKIINLKDKAKNPQIWFTDWNNSDLLKELDRKKRQEVY